MLGTQQLACHHKYMIKYKRLWNSWIFQRITLSFLFMEKLHNCSRRRGHDPIPTGFRIMSPEGLIHSTEVVFIFRKRLA